MMYVQYINICKCQLPFAQNISRESTVVENNSCIILTLFFCFCNICCVSHSCDIRPRLPTSGKRFFTLPASTPTSTETGKDAQKKGCMENGAYITLKKSILPFEIATSKLQNESS